MPTQSVNPPVKKSSTVRFASVDMHGIVSFSSKEEERTRTMIDAGSIRTKIEIGEIALVCLFLTYIACI